jgi:hypothetical protein
LAQHPVVVRAHPRVPGSTQHQQVVEKAPAFARVATHERQVLRREQHCAQDPQHVSGLGDLRAVDPRAVRLAGRDLQLDRQLAIVVDHRGADDRPRRTVSDERRVGGDPV